MINIWDSKIKNQAIKTNSTLNSLYLFKRKKIIKQILKLSTRKMLDYYIANVNTYDTYTMFAASG